MEQVKEKVVKDHALLKKRYLLKSANSQAKRQKISIASAEATSKQSLGFATS